MRFRAAVMHAANAPLTIETIEAAPLEPDDVLVRIGAASICHTDLEVLSGEIRYPMPMVLGHEASGTVEETGSSVANLRSGDRVVLSWNPHCGHCYYCENNQPILCEAYVKGRADGAHFDGGHRLTLKGRRLNTLMYIGGFAEYCVVPSQSAIKVPDEMPFDCGCLIGCGVMTGVGAATRVARVAWGAAVLVLGCGAIGLSAIQGARMAGAGIILAVDFDDRKLAVARELGATHACNAGKEDPIAAIKALTEGRGADYVFEAAGNEKAFRASIEGCRPGGQVVWLGKVNVDREVSFRWGTLMGERHIVRSSYGGARPNEDFPSLSRAYLRGDLKLDHLVTARIPLERINEGFDLLREGKAIRTVIDFAG